MPDRTNDLRSRVGGGAVVVGGVVVVVVVLLLLLLLLFVSFSFVTVVVVFFLTFCLLCSSLFFPLLSLHPSSKQLEAMCDPAKTNLPSLQAAKVEEIQPTTIMMQALFEHLCRSSDIDHPLCDECANTVMGLLDAKIKETKQDVAAIEFVLEFLLWSDCF